MTQAITSTATGATAAADPTAADKAKLKSAAQAFEAVFLRQMISSMRSASLGDGLTDSDASNQFRDMADANTADAMAKRGVLGIAGMLEKQLGARLGGIVQTAEHAVGTLAGDAATAAAKGVVP